MAHPGIVTVYEIDSDDTYVVLELMDLDMRELVGVAEPLLLDAYIQAGRAVAFAHEHGVVHLDLKPENVLARLDTDKHGRVVGLWAKVADFGATQAIRPRGDLEPADALARTGQRAGGALEDQRAFAGAVWEALSGGQQPPNGSELLPPELHAVLSRALMADPGQRWADMAALVDAIERGRGSTAATAKAATLIDMAILQAEDGVFSVATQLWADARRILVDQHVVLGEGGLALGATLLQAAAEQISDTVRRRGYQRALEVLEVALEALEAAAKRELACDAAELAATACERILELQPAQALNTEALERRATRLRARYHELTMPATNNDTIEEETTS